MARNKANQSNINGSDLVAYPNKRIRDNDGSGNGTPVNEVVYGDLHELKDKFMREAGISFNGLPDNETNGHQLYEAFREVAGKNDLVKNLSQISTTTVLIPIKISILKNDEQIIFQSLIDSLTTQNLIKGTEVSVKNLEIQGQFKVGDFVRMINTPTKIILVGEYDSKNVPNLIQRLTNIENAIQPMINKLAIFQSGGGMLFWNKPLVLIPFGWHEVVDWRGRMPVGFTISDPDFNVLGANGGSKTKQILKANIPNYNLTRTVGLETPAGGPNVIWSNAPGGSFTETINSGGSDAPFNVMNPFRTVLFIEYTGI